jgi:type II secretory pathway component GspD/PulD (secretin)
MNRLPQGARFGRPVSIILASSLVISTSLPMYAASSDSGSQDTALKTLAPLEDPQATPTSAAPDAAASRLQFTPGDAAASSDLPDAWSTAPRPVAPSSGAKDGTAVSQAPPDSSNAGVGRDGNKQLAQSLPGMPRATTDPLYRHIPPVQGSVNLHSKFKLFPTDTIIHNLEFRETPVKEVVAELGRRGHLNIMLDRSTVGRITGDLHDMTLNEAMDTVLTSAGLTWRQMDNSTIIVGEQASLTRLGLNRPILRCFRLSYANAFEVANLLWATVFNKGYIPDFSSNIRNRFTETTTETPTSRMNDQLARHAASATAGGGTQSSDHAETSAAVTNSNTTIDNGDDLTATIHLDQVRGVRAQLRDQINEGSGFNSGSTDPGTQTIRSSVVVQTDFPVDQNGGGTIVVPDTKNHQVMVIGTAEDIAIAEEAIRLIDRRPRMIHVQSSLVEIDSTAIRQLGAALNLQGAGASGTVLGGSGSPMINSLPGLGSGASQIVNTFTGSGALAGLTSSITNNVVGINPIASSFTQNVPNGSISSTRTSTLTPVTLAGNGFSGLLGTILPGTPPSTTGVQAASSAVSGFNFLTLSKSAGGRANIATVPAGLNLSLNLALQSGKGKLLANPSVLVEDNTEALISLANEVIHKVTTTASLGVISTNVELVQAGIFLDVLPRSTEDGFIVMRLRPQVSTPLGPVQQFANGTVLITLLNVRQVLAQEVRIKDGQTLVLGGLFSEQESATLSKVPYLSEAPILGALFRNTLKGRNRTELMLLITPKIVEEPPPNALSEANGPTPPL